MRWTWLDYSLLTIVLLTVLLAGQESANSACQLNKCITLNYYHVDHTAPVPDSYYEYEFLDCRSCINAGGGGHCDDVGMVYPPKCVNDETTNQRLRTLITGDLQCALPPLGVAEAKNPRPYPETEVPWINAGKRKHCMPD
jgi:hypothetical protein